MSASSRPIARSTAITRPTPGTTAGVWRPDHLADGDHPAPVAEVRRRHHPMPLRSPPETRRHRTRFWHPKTLVWVESLFRSRSGKCHPPCSADLPGHLTDDAHRPGHQPTRPQSFTAPLVSRLIAPANKSSFRSSYLNKKRRVLAINWANRQDLLL